ncbi:MAG: hypothetical protein OHK0038_28070 [Flammeovirgaceae bacterium]
MTNKAEIKARTANTGLAKVAGAVLRRHNRIGSIVTVVTSPSDPTNDMILTTDGTYIYVPALYWQ